MVPSDRIAEKEPHLRAGIPREERHVRPRVSRIRIASFSRRTFSAHGVQYLRCAAGLSIAVPHRAHGLLGLLALRSQLPPTLITGSQWRRDSERSANCHGGAPRFSIQPCCRLDEGTLHIAAGGFGELD
jgi:hypothetical protein